MRQRLWIATLNLWHLALFWASVALLVLVLYWLPGTFWFVLGAWHAADWLTRLAWIAVIAAWLIFRIGQATARAGVILALKTELELHRSWTGREWKAGEYGQGWDSPWYSVYQLSTGAIDNAITQGAGLLLSRELLALVVRYRQQLRHLSQLIDAATSFQVELAKGTWSPYLIERIRIQTEKIHGEGIGDRTSDAAYYWFQQIQAELAEEQRAPVSFLVWFVTGLRVYRGERLVYYAVWWLLFWRVPHDAENEVAHV